LPLARAEMVDDLEKIIEFVDDKVYNTTQRHLRDVEVWIFKGSWVGQKYDEIARNHNYTSQYLQQDIGPRFWKLLSEVFQEQVSKRNFRSVLERHLRQTQSEKLLIQHPPISFSQRAISSLPAQQSASRCDWGEAMDVSVCYGRTEDLNLLQKWVITHDCRLIALLGMGGIGKTTLSIKLAETLQQHFDIVIWRSLRNAPEPKEILNDWIQFISNQSYLPQSERLDARLRQILHYLRKYRCLLILDNFESVLQEGQSTGAYCSEYEGYGQILRCVAETQHRSCLILTSREKPKGFTQREGLTLPVRSLPLRGLSEVEGQGIFLDKGCTAVSLQNLQEIFAHYGGNPLALKIAASAIQEITGGDIVEFLPYLHRGAVQFEDIQELLTHQFNRLTPVEQQVMGWLAINRSAVSFRELQQDVVSNASCQHLPEAIQSLGRRSLIESQDGLLSLQPVVMEYVTHRLVMGVCQEILRQNPSELLNQYALQKAQSKDYIRQAQTRFILQPILERLRSLLGGTSAVIELLKKVLSQLQPKIGLQDGYTAGNLLNLLMELKADINGMDLSGLAIWQAHLVGTTLQNVNCANVHFSRVAFTTVLNAALSMTYSPDGQLLAIGNADNKVRIWQVEGYKELFTCEGHGSWVFSVAFTPDGGAVASGSFDKTVKLWDVTTGRCLRTLEGHTGWIFGVAISPDGQLLVSASNDRTFRVWDKHTGECLQTMLADTTVWCVSFSPDGRWLASGHDDGTVCFWQVENWQLVKTLSGHSNWVRTVAFSPDGQYLVSGSNDTTLRVWEVETGNCVKVLTGHTLNVNAVTFHPDGEILATGSNDTTVRLWDFATGQCFKVLQGHSVALWTVAFHPDGSTLASGSNDSTIKVWQVTGESLRTFQGYCAGVKTIHLNPSSPLLASAGDDKVVRIWNIETGQCVQMLTGYFSWIWCLRFSPTHNLLASGGGSDYTIRLWNLQTSQPLRDLQGHNNVILSIAFSPNGFYLASGSIDETVKLWKPLTGECVKTLTHPARVWSVGFSPDSQCLVSGVDDATVKVWDISTGDCLKTLEGHQGLVFTVVYSPTGLVIASGSDDKTIKLWDVQSGTCLQTLVGHQAVVRSLAFHADGNLLASSSDDKTIKLWDIQSGNCIQTFQGHTAEVWEVTFDSQQQQLISASQDEMIKIWDIATGTCLRSLRDRRPYENMNITGVTGLTEAQKQSLRALGAITTNEPINPSELDTSYPQAFQEIYPESH
jgi:WD40 repeat protein